MDEEPTPKPCAHHARVGREYDPGCYACQRDYTNAFLNWRAKILTDMRAIVMESQFEVKP